MYTEKNNSGSLTLSHYTSLIPNLGPCGFSRAEEVYDITTPSTFGKIPRGELKIQLIGDKYKFVSYTGYIEFLSQNKVFVDLYRNVNGTPIPISINGKHKIKVEPDEIYIGTNR